MRYQAQEEVDDYAYPMLMAQKCLNLAQGELLAQRDERAVEMLSVAMKWILDAQTAILGKR